MVSRPEEALTTISQFEVQLTLHLLSILEKDLNLKFKNPLSISFFISIIVNMWNHEIKHSPILSGLSCFFHFVHMISTETERQKQNQRGTMKSQLRTCIRQDTRAELLLLQSFCCGSVSSNDSHKKEKKKKKKYTAIGFCSVFGLSRSTCGGFNYLDSQMTLTKVSDKLLLQTLFLFCHFENVKYCIKYNRGLQTFRGGNCCGSFESCKQRL